MWFVIFGLICFHFFSCISCGPLSIFFHDFWGISYIFSCISSRMWFIISNLSLVLLASVSTSRNLDLYSRLCKKDIVQRLTLVGDSQGSSFINMKFKHGQKRIFFGHLFSCHMGNLVNFTSVLNLKKNHACNKDSFI